MKRLLGLIIVCSCAYADDTITSSNTVMTTPNSAYAPSVINNNSDVCTSGASGGAQTRGFGFSAGKATRDLNCERIKLARSLQSLGLKVAAVAVLCADRRVFDGMIQAGTPCPFDGLIGDEAKAAWLANPELIPEREVERESRTDSSSAYFSRSQ